MEAEFWQKRWSEDRIGFHQEDVNKCLQRYWSALELPNSASVFVPLCGKSNDMLWLHQQGHRVFGVELSAKAVEAFFVENSLTYSRRQQDGFDIFTGEGAAQGIELWAGDFFTLTPAHLADCSAVYDRASLIAMNSDMRAAYATHLGQILKPSSKGLLLVISYDEARMTGPPFSVSDATVQTLLGNSFTIDELAHYSGPERLGNLAKRGLETLDERVYLLKRNP